jgi:hypothetical protein
VLTDEEMAAVGQLVQDIEREAAESEMPTVWDETPRGEKAPPIDIVELNVPPLAGREISGSDDAGESFTLSLAALTCSCEDWRNLRSSLPDRSPGRLCRHLVAEVNRVKDTLTEMNAAFSWLLGERAQRGKGTHPVEFYNLLMTDDGTCLVSFGSSKWAHLLVPIEEAAYDRYGYDFAEQRWSYGRQPVGFGPVKRYVLDLRVEG